MGTFRSPHSHNQTFIDLISAEIDKIYHPKNTVNMKGDINVDNLMESMKNLAQRKL